jgi:hypothetical protein
MSKTRTQLTIEQSEEVKQIVLTCILANRTVNETIDIIDRRLNVRLAVDTIKHIRMKVRKETFDELQTMKMDNDAYVYEYLKDIHQIKNVIKETWNLADLALQDKDYELRRRCLSDINTYTQTLHKLYDFLPAACSMKTFVWELAPYAHTTTNYNNKELSIL